MKSPVLLNVAPYSIAPSATNPRKFFPEDYIKELSTSIAARGILQPLLVRTAPPEVASAGFLLELIAGECRLRAAHIAQLDQVPVLVRDDLSSNDVVELQLIENLQRRDLDALEEAESYAQLLALDDDGSKRHTVESLAQAIGKSIFYVLQRLCLNHLPPEGKDALRSGELSFSVARRVAIIPSEVLRSRALEAVLHPEYEEEPLTARAAASYIRDHFMVDLKGAPFSKEDAVLVPVEIVDDQRVMGGACAACPFLSGNMSECPDGSANLCTHPECYGAKVEAAWEEQRMEALKAGKRVLSEKESEKVVDKYCSGVRWDSNFVALSDSIPHSELSNEVNASGKPPTWKKALKGVAVPPEICVVRDRNGKALDVVDRRQAIAAIKLEAKTKGSSCVLKSGGASDSSDQASDRAAEREKTKLAQETVFAAMTALDAQLSENRRTRDWERPLLNSVIDVTTSDAHWFFCQWLSIDTDSDFKSDAIKKALEKVTGPDLIPKICLLLLAGSLRWAASNTHSTDPFTGNFREFAEAFSIDLDVISDSVKKEFLADKKAADAEKEAKKKPVDKKMKKAMEVLAAK